MKHAKKILTLTSALVLIFIITATTFTTTAEAAAVLESPAAATASIGNSFEIIARGRGGFRVDDSNDFDVNYQTRIVLDFLIVRQGERGVLLDVLMCEFRMNETVFSLSDGFGFAGRPQHEQLNGTIAFGFRINMTGSSGESVTLEFLGRVMRTQDYGPLLFMRGRLISGDLIFVFGQIGRIHRI